MVSDARHDSINATIDQNAKPRGSQSDKRIALAMPAMDSWRSVADPTISKGYTDCTVMETTTNGEGL